MLDMCILTYSSWCMLHFSSIGCKAYVKMTITKTFACFFLEWTNVSQLNPHSPIRQLLVTPGAHRWGDHHSDIRTHIQGQTSSGGRLRFEICFPQRKAHTLNLCLWIYVFTYPNNNNNDYLWGIGLGMILLLLLIISLSSHYHHPQYHSVFLYFLGCI